MDKMEGASEPRKTQCQDTSKCFQLLESILDGEIDNSKDMLKDKLAKCQPCFEHFHLEQAIRDVLRNKCTKQQLPAELAQSIRSKIQEMK